LANSGIVGGRLFVFRSMPETTHFTSTDPIGRISSGAPHIAGIAVAFPPNRYDQDEVARELTTFAEPGFMRFALPGARGGAAVGRTVLAMMRSVQ
jgi:hypothetical protein